MNAEKPAEGILLHRDYGDARQYTIVCECCSTDCTHQVWIEAEDTGVTVYTYTQQKTKWWEFNRFKIIWTILTKGYIEYQASIIMTEQQALNYSKVLESSVEDVKKFRQQRIKKNNEQNKNS